LRERQATAGLDVAIQNGHSTEVAEEKHGNGCRK
jgi:hypothetical protein